MPKRMAARIATMTSSAEGSTVTRLLMTRAPPRAPMTMMPSRPRLMTPECSEIQPPRATSVSTEEKIRVYWMSSSITDRLLSRQQGPVSWAPCLPA